MSKDIKQKFEELVNASRELRWWILENGDPHTKIIVEIDRVEVLEGKMAIPHLYEDTKKNKDF